MLLLLLFNFFLGGGTELGPHRTRYPSPDEQRMNT